MLIIDAHCHVVPTTEGVQTLYQRMEEAGVQTTVVVPGGMIPTLGFADFLRGTQALITSSPANRFILDLALSSQGKVKAFYQIDPLYDEPEDIHEAAASGFSGFKLNPLVNRVAFEDGPLWELLDAVGQHEMPLYAHITLSGQASLEAFESMVKRFPGLPFILGHMGFASTDLSAIKLAQRYENVHLETSIGSYAAICEALKRLGAGRLIFGSEGPVHHPIAELTKLRACCRDENELELVLGKNIINLLERT